jgi:hypothetical protein
MFFRNFIIELRLKNDETHSEKYKKGYVTMSVQSGVKIFYYFPFHTLLLFKYYSAVKNVYQHFFTLVHLQTNARNYYKCYVRRFECSRKCFQTITFGNNTSAHGLDVNHCLIR